jgi:hypothetical protein
MSTTGQKLPASAEGVVTPKIISAQMLKPAPKFELSPEQLEKFKEHCVGELQNLKEQTQNVVQERLELEQRIKALASEQQQLQGAAKELFAFSSACGVDLNAEDKKLAEAPKQG